MANPGGPLLRTTRASRKKVLLAATLGVCMAVAMMMVFHNVPSRASGGARPLLGGAVAERNKAAQLSGEGDPVTRFIRNFASNQNLTKVTKNSGFGLVTGVCAGYATKKIGQAAALIAGGTLLAAQGLSHTGFVQVNWHKVQKLFNRYTDLNHDGVTNAEDLVHGWQKIKKILTTEMVPSAAGFSAGFALGIFGL